MIDRVRRSPWAVFMLLAVVAVAVYRPGLQGPLLLDDFDNLRPVSEFLDGERSAFSVIRGNKSGPLGRPIAMASFVLDAKLFGNSVWHAKRTNLVIHLLCGFVMFGVLRRLLAFHPELRHQAPWLPALLAGTWLLLPVNVSTVLYLVQRMAMLSTLFMLVGLWVFLWARERIANAKPGGGIALWLGVPICTLLAVLSKENGALLPLLALALEFGILRRSTGTTGRNRVNAFFAVTVLVPAVLLVALLLLRPDAVFSGYAKRDFTLGERLLTQFRILWEYVATILVPYSPRLGLYHDNYPRSVGLFSPATTVLAIAAWIGLLAGAWRLRLAAPLLLVGLLLYLGAHSMESSIFPLELYFEHRNYLPSMGLLLAVAGATSLAAGRLGARTRAFRRTAPVLVLLVPLVYAWATLGRAQVWSSEELIMAQELRYNAESPRMRMTLGTYAIRAGRLEEALEHVRVAERNLPEHQVATIALWRLAAYCTAKQRPPEALFDDLERSSRGRVEFYARIGLDFLGLLIDERKCGEFDVERLVEIVTDWVSNPELDSKYIDVWRSRFRLGRLLLYLERYEEADQWMYRVWNDSGRMPSVGVLAFRLAATVGDQKRCDEILRSLETYYGKGDARFDRAVDAFRSSMASTSGSDRPDVDPEAIPDLDSADTGDSEGNRKP